MNRQGNVHGEQGDSRASGSTSHAEQTPTAYTYETTLPFGSPQNVRQLEGRLSSFLAELTDSLKREGCTLIGHIKGLLTAGEGGHLFFSLTSFDRHPNFKGRFADPITQAKFTVNAIVYGLEYGQVEELVRRGLSGHFGNSRSD